jgi:hypothetical protein
VASALKGLLKRVANEEFVVFNVDVAEIQAAFADNPGDLDVAQNALMPGPGYSVNLILDDGTAAVSGDVAKFKADCAAATSNVLTDPADLLLSCLSSATPSVLSLLRSPESTKVFRASSYSRLEHADLASSILP